MRLRHASNSAEVSGASLTTVTIVRSPSCQSWVSSGGRAGPPSSENQQFFTSSRLKASSIVSRRVIAARPRPMQQHHDHSIGKPGDSAVAAARRPDWYPLVVRSRGGVPKDRQHFRLLPRLSAARSLNSRSTLAAKATEPLQRPRQHPRPRQRLLMTQNRRVTESRWLSKGVGKLSRRSVSRGPCGLSHEKAVVKLTTIHHNDSSWSR